MICQIPGCVKGRAVCSCECEFCVLALDAEILEIEIARTVIFSARVFRFPELFDHVLGSTVRYVFRFPCVDVQFNVYLVQSLLQPVDHALGRLPYLGYHSVIPCLESSQEIGYLLLHLRVGFHHPVGCAVERYESVVGLLPVRLLNVLRRYVIDAPCQYDDLLPDIIDIVFCGDIVTAEPHRPRKSVTYYRIPGSSHVDGPGGVGGSVLHIHPDAVAAVTAVAIARFQYLIKGPAHQDPGVHREI